MPRELIILVGMPGAGKTTLASEFANRLGSVVVSTETIREAMGIDDPQSQNGKVFGELYEQIKKWLRIDKTVIADSTALSASTRSNMTDIARRQGASTHAIVFDMPEEARKRNEGRDRVVPDDVMSTMERRLQLTLRSIRREDFDSITLISDMEGA